MDHSTRPVVAAVAPDPPRRLGDRDERHPQPPPQPLPSPALKRYAEQAAGLDPEASQGGGSLRPAIAELRVDDATGHVLVRILDPATRAVIRQLPNEETARVTQVLKDYSALLARRHSSAQAAQHA